MHFRDKSGRTVILRGVNLADGKFPLGKPTYHLESLEEPESCTYVNTFFTLPDDDSTNRNNAGSNGTNTNTTSTTTTTTDAHTHLTRLRFLGFNILRIPVVWEALEHSGPGVYDDAYIDYIYRLVKLCTSPPHNFRVIINPHQDLWSRFAGGSGAPLWTLHACGLDERFFGETHACVQYANWPVDEADPGRKDPKGIPPMMWTTNHNRLAAMTLFALFFGGKVVAPKCRLRYRGGRQTNGDSNAGGLLDGQENGVGNGDRDGYENIQDFLQRHYFAAYARLMARLGDLPFAYDSMNEPEPGYIGIEDLSTIEREDTAKIGSTPTPIESMRLGMAQEQTVDEYRLGKTGPHKDGKMTIKPKHKCWLDKEDPRWAFDRAQDWEMGTCVWALHGVWDVSTGDLLEKDYFQKALPEKFPAATDEDNGGKERLTFVSSFWQDFHRRWNATIREHSRTAITFVQPPVFSPPPPRDDDSDHHHLLAYSPHYYDGLTVMHRHWHERWNADVVGLLRGHHKTKVTGLRVGKDNVRKAISSQLGILAEDTHEIPTLIGEMGIPFNLDDGKAYKKKQKPDGSVAVVEAEDGDGAGDYTDHVKALDAMLTGCDEHLLNYTLWAYSSINTHEWGDHWNGEDLSIYSAETGSFRGHEHLAGFRAAAAWCRPFVESCGGDGELKGMRFDLTTSEFEVEVNGVGSRLDDGQKGSGDAVIYLPWLHYRKSDESAELALDVEAPDGTSWRLGGPQQIVWTYGGGRTDGESKKLVIRRKGGALSEKELGTIV